MSERNNVISLVSAALERETSVNLHRYPVWLEYSDGVLTITGEVENIMMKKMALEKAASCPGVSGIVDRLRLVAAREMEDGDIRDHVRDALLAENLLSMYGLRVMVKGKPEEIRDTGEKGDGYIEVEVEDGVVILNGIVTSLSAKRLAGVLAWWVPGSRDVVNGIEVAPPEEDNDDEVIDAIRLVLEKNPFIDAAQVRVACRNFSVTIEGIVKSEAQRSMAETDCWYVFRVDRVTNLLQVEG